MPACHILTSKQALRNGAGHQTFEDLVSCSIPQSNYNRRKNTVSIPLNAEKISSSPAYDMSGIPLAEPVFWQTGRSASVYDADDGAEADPHAGDLPRPLRPLHDLLTGTGATYVEIAREGPTSVGIIVRFDGGTGGDRIGQLETALSGFCGDVTITVVYL